MCPYDDNNLPKMVLKKQGYTEENLKALNSCVLDEFNQNLSSTQKELMKWHNRLGHLGLGKVQSIMRSGALGESPLIKAAANCPKPICASCAYGKARRLPSHVKSSKTTTEKELSKETLIPGQKVSMDHFIVTSPGRLFSSRGSESYDRRYKGGVIFVDHASGHIQAVPVVNFTAGEAIRAKREYEAEMATLGITVINYHTDNGVFTAAEYQDELAKLGQGMTLSGVGAHHQNAVAERAIGTIVSMTRTMMIHAKLRWPGTIKPDLWPMAMKHAQYILNHTPRMNNVCPLDIVLKTSVTRSALKNLHVWGCPVYILDPKLQDGQKFPNGILDPGRL